MATIPTAAALDLMYRSSTTGAPTAEFDRLGGYAAVKAAAEAAGYGATPEFIQSYEIANNLPESAHTKLNKQFIGSEGAAKMAQMEADLNSQNAALAAQTRANLAAQSAAADQQAAAEAAQRAAAANIGGWGPAPTSDELRQMAQDLVTLRYLNEDLYTKTGKTYDTIAEAQAAQRAASAPQVAVPQAAAQQVAAQQAAAQQAAAQQVAAQQVAAQQAAVQRAAQARSTGLLDVAPAPRAAATAGPAINRPTAMAQPSYAQVAPAQITNRAITGTPYSSIYSPATMRQNAPTLASVQAAARSSNPYAALMALSQQQLMPGSYAGPAGATAANPYLGGYNPNIYNPATATGLLTTPSAGIYSSGAGVEPGGAEGGIKGGGGGIPGLNIDPLAYGFARVANLFGSSVSLGTPAPVTDATFNPTQAGIDYAGASGKTSWGKSGNAEQDIGPSVLNSPQQNFRAAELAAQNLAERNAFTEGITGLLGGGQISPFENAIAQNISDAKMEAAAIKAADAAQFGTNPAVPASVQEAQNAVNAAAIAEANLGGYGYGGNTGNFGGGSNSFGEGQYAKGGMVNMNPQMHNPPGPDDGYAALDNGEYVIKKSAVKKYGSNIFEQINAGRIPAQRLKSLLE